MRRVSRYYLGKEGKVNITSKTAYLLNMISHFESDPALKDLLHPSSTASSRIAEMDKRIFRVRRAYSD